MHRSLVVTVIALIASLLCSAAASAAPIAPYDGENPFRCKTQNTGLGVDFPDPGRRTRSASSTTRRSRT